VSRAGLFLAGALVTTVTKGVLTDVSPSARFAIFITIALSIWLLQHLYVGWRVLSLPALSAVAARRAVLLGLSVAFLTYPLGRTLFAIGWQGLGRAFEYIGSVWMGTLFLLIAFLLAVEVITAGGLLLRQSLDQIRTTAVLVALLAAAVAWIGGLRAPRTVEVSLPATGLAPAAKSEGGMVANPVTVVQISDVHLGTMLGRGKLNAVIDQVDALTPDLVVITGDLIDGDAGVVEELLPELRRLRAPMGVYAVLGNHEFYAGSQRSHRLLADAGFAVLDNRSVEVVPGLHVAGVPDARGSAQTGEPGADLEAALAGIPEEAFTVLLQHSPENEEQAAAAGVDLMLNGHTHGGQIWPFHIPVRLFYRHYAGIHRVGGMTQVVCRGTGHWGPPMRLLAPAEIVRVTIGKPDH
jgi:predicted MPP superfamily phosphohydrolase